ncbi:jg18116 [Pararge aegeria aegeria]|uniref:Jg18116 protein n=1 Tax=Pararge aegeria aegeria TaxID=348720 RepID=A0A8S4QH05_9NEOP|nr:jg18116 [Pararge aegeria aegeria]
MPVQPWTQKAGSLPTVPLGRQKVTTFLLPSQNIVDIFNYASKTDPAFERVRNNQFHLALKIYILFHAVSFKKVFNFNLVTM